MVVLGICGGHDANWCVFKDGKLFAILDIDSPEKDRFSEEEATHLEGFVKILEKHL